MTALATARRLLSNGTVRAFVMLSVFMIVWATMQVGGLNVFLINSWLLLSLPLVIAAIGVTLVIFTGEFDLSAAGVVTLTNVLMAVTFSGMGWLGMALAVLIGAGVGLLNGFFVIVMRLPAIAVTLSTLIVLQGLSLVIMPTPGGRIDGAIVDFFGGPFVVPRSILFLVVIALVWFVYRRTPLGIHSLGVGEDEEALRLAGAPVARVKFAVFSIAGGLYGLAGVALAAAVQTGDAAVGSSYLLATFAAVAIGGTAFTGGSGSVLGTIVGALTLTVIPKVLFVIGVSGWLQNIFTGLLIIAATLVGALSARHGATRTTACPPGSNAEHSPTPVTEGGGSA